MNLKNKYNNIIKCLVLLFAFIFVGVLFSGVNVEAKDNGPIIIVPNDYKLENGDLQIYIGYNENNFNYIKYGFSSNNLNNSISIDDYTSVSNKKEICDLYNKGGECPEELRAFTISKSKIENEFKPNSTYDGSNDGIVNLYVEADNEKSVWFIPLGGGKTNKNVDLVLDNQSPSVTSINVAINGESSFRTLKINDIIEFTVNFNEAIFNKNAKLKFKIGNSSKTISCTNNLNDIKSYLKCSYRVVERDDGAISFESLVSNNNVKDRYNNKVAGNVSLSNISVNKVLMVDGIKPVLQKLEVIKGIYSVHKGFEVKAVFSEAVRASRNDLPTLNLSPYANCSVRETTDNAIVYACSVSSSEKNGTLTSAIINYSTSYIYDLNGNALETINNKTYNLVVTDETGSVIEGATISVNSKNPELSFEEVNYKITRDGLVIDSKYVKKDDVINISIPVSEGVDVTSANVNCIQVYFGDVSASPSISFAGNKLVIDITIQEEYNGKLKINFKDFTITGENGSDKVINYNLDFNVYSDNSNPIISNSKAMVTDGKFISDVIYSGNLSVVKFEMELVDVSELVIDFTKIYLKSGSNVINIANSNITFLNNKLTINVTSDYLSGLNNFYVVIEKSAFKDIFGNTLVDDYDKEYKVDSNAPIISMNFDYPMYKGVSVGDKNYLVSGNKVEVNLSSEDKDLKEYCLSNTSEDCEGWENIGVDSKFSYSFPSYLDNGEYNVYLCIRDYASNQTCINKTLEINKAFDYKSGMDVQKNHLVGVNAFMLEENSDFYYKWVKEGSSVSNFSSVLKKNSSSILIESNGNLNGNYMLCIKQDELIICGDYLKFDNDIDDFSVDFSIDLNSEYTRETIGTVITFNDISTIKCVAVGKNVNSVNCERGKSNVTYYAGSDFGSPISAYSISENGEYTFYVEDIIGNSKSLKYVIENIDREKISISIYNEEGNSNLEADIYKNKHVFKVLFDEGVNGSNHVKYSYFFTTRSYITNESDVSSVFYSEDNFNNYLYSTETKLYKNIVDASTLNSKQLVIETPISTGKYNLYIKAIDSAENISYACVKDILVDKDAPSIVMKDENGELTNGDSSTYITNFKYVVEVSEELSYINKDEVYYEFIESSSNKSVLKVKYEGCELASKSCVIKNVSLDASKFSSGLAYRFRVTVMDSAGNTASYTSNNLYIKIPTISINTSLDQNKFTNSNDISFSIVRSSNDANISRVAYCLNDCSYDNKTLSSGFVNLSLNSSNTYVINDLDYIEGINKLYVYVIDENGNDKLEIISVKYDSIKPNIDDKYVSLYTNNSSNLYVSLEGDKVYNYSNELQIKLRFSVNSLFDKVNGNNSNLKLHVCFGTSCSDYDVTSSLKDGYYINRELSVTSPVYYSGIVSYYVYDEANNKSDTKQVVVRYSNSVDDVSASIYDSLNNDIDVSKKYNKVVLKINGEVSSLITKQYIRYALVSSSINLREEKENYSGSLNDFLNLYGFRAFDSDSVEITKDNVDGSYYVWVFVRNEINNYSISKVNKLVNLDTIKPDFVSTIVDFRKNSDTNYSLVMHESLVSDNLYIKVNDDYELVEFSYVNNEYVYSFDKNESKSSFALKIVDEALNENSLIVDYVSIVNSTFAKAYFNAKNKNIKVTLNNLNGKSVTGFVYVIDEVTSTSGYNIDSLEVCDGTSNEPCKSQAYSVSNNVYTISIQEDKKITFYIYVDYTLIDLVSVITKFDEEAPSVYYALKNGSNSYSSTYNLISENVAYVSGAIKVKMSDNKGISHFDLYSFNGNELLSTCYFESNAGDYNCNRDNIETSGNNLFYKLESGNYTIRVYDKSNNVREVKIVTDTTSPSIKLYKKIGDTYYYESVISSIYGSLEGLYVSVIEDNFSKVDVTVSKGSSNTYLSYGYTSTIGKCLVDKSSCEYGASVLDLIGNSSSEYDKITIKVYDKSNRVNELVINYDDSIPNIYINDIDGSVIELGNSEYVINGEKINVEIGKDDLDLRDLLIGLNLNIDGMGYDALSNKNKFKVEVYKDSVLYTYNLFDSIGDYEIKINYTSDAGNKAEEKVFRVSVIDSLAPVIEIIDSYSTIELNEEVEILGARVSDNYALEIINGSTIKEKELGLDKAVCEGDICLNIAKEGNTYKFKKAGTYSFVYTVNDASSNTSSVTQVLVVKDNKAPVITGAYGDEDTFEVYVGERNVLNEIVIPTFTLKKPSSYDIGDADFIETVFSGVYVTNNIGTKALSDETHLVSEDASGLKFKFSKVGTYYIRFTSMDSTNHMSEFEYVVKVIDNIAPSIIGISDNYIVELDLDSSFNVKDDIINKYNVEAKDNYYSNVNVTYELQSSDSYDYEVTLIAKDLSSNEMRVVVYVRFIDRTKPVAGDLVLPSSTNSNSIKVEIVGGEDNSNNWWHEYNIQNGSWIKYSEDSKIEFGANLNAKEVNVCVRAVDAYQNISDNITCKVIVVDTSLPVISGVHHGDVTSGEVEISVSDNSLVSVKVWFNNELMDLTKDDFPTKFNKRGSYRVEALDSFENKAVVDFVINTDTYVNVVNDIKSESYTITSVEFDKRLLVGVNASRDSNGYLNITTDLSNLAINNNDIVYILGLVPNTNDTFILYSMSGSDVVNSNNIVLISNGEKFVDGAKNLDYFLNFNDSYYAYAIVKKETSESVETISKENKEKKNSALTTVMIAAGSVVVLFLGYQIIRFRRRVRAA